MSKLLQPSQKELVTRGDTAQQPGLYPVLDDGLVLLPFPRLFTVATRAL